MGGGVLYIVLFFNAGDISKDYLNTYELFHLQKPFLLTAICSLSCALSSVFCLL